MFWIVVRLWTVITSVDYANSAKINVLNSANNLFFFSGIKINK